MNYYERVERAICYIEENLDQVFDLEELAGEAFMSLRSFYRMFFALTGYTVKEYIRNRRFSQAADEIKSGKKILDMALKYGYSSHEAFTRSFQKTTGMLPGSLKKGDRIFAFERVSILDKYYDIQDDKLLEKYPDIKVLKELDPMRVAYYCYTGKDPEKNAWEVMSKWLLKSGLDIEKDSLRIYGFNNPEAEPGQEEYGYEYWVTIDQDTEVNDPQIGVKAFPGGHYAVTTVRGGVEAIYPTWQRLAAWLSESKYTYGGHQWLEEHLDFDDELNHLGGFDLYIPIEPRC